ncbi:rhodanese-like domain-containing protein [Chitinivorax sp. B]|uniref:rhodanese-like domain-containing protein n=1 Tax=Chitinivorax sp. B TaxID=2502235 RepID=UPI0014857F2C|nr:rhodanese-like domain-containing protein [Chitinivorax sp. B]
MNGFTQFPSEMQPACSCFPTQAMLVDVRASCEFQAGHLPNAVSLPIDDLRDLIREHYPDKTTPIVVYCKSGLRSARAEHILQGMGYLHVHNGGSMLELAQWLPQFSQ